MKEKKFIFLKFLLFCSMTLVASEKLILQEQEALNAANRSKAMVVHNNTTENNYHSSFANPPSVLIQRTREDITVGNGCTYSTISQAIAAANPGDRLLIEGGRTFTENIFIDKHLILQGGYDGAANGSSDRTIIDGNASGSVVIISQGIEVTLLNINITNGSNSAEGGGIRFAMGEGTGTLNLANMRIHNNSASWGGGIWAGIDTELFGENVEICNCHRQYKLVQKRQYKLIQI
ncbi:MAG: hypothetical protein PHR06_08380 [Candidatus Cloacimonetes bacterium]|nr:hypothetical protein [Candidatus Cloacimonadota bacterium]